jgi:hypothetical protein
MLFPLWMDVDADDRGGTAQSGPDGGVSRLAANSRQPR